MTSWSLALPDEDCAKANGANATIKIINNFVLIIPLPVVNIFRSSPHEYPVRVGAVNRRVTQRARLILLRLVVGRANGRLRRERMALQTHQIYLAHAQETRIG